jgi:hypothetical protein
MVPPLIFFSFHLFSFVLFFSLFFLNTFLSLFGFPKPRCSGNNLFQRSTRQSTIRLADADKAPINPAGVQLIEKS